MTTKPTVPPCERSADYHWHPSDRLKHRDRSCVRLELFDQSLTGERRRRISWNESSWNATLKCQLFLFRHYLQEINRSLFINLVEVLSSSQVYLVFVTNMVTRKSCVGRLSLFRLSRRRCARERPIAVVESSSTAPRSPWVTRDDEWLVFCAVEDPWACTSCRDRVFSDSPWLFDVVRSRLERSTCEHCGSCRASVHHRCQSLCPRVTCSILDADRPAVFALPLQGERIHRGASFDRQPTWFFTTKLRTFHSCHRSPQTNQTIDLEWKITS